ncbi:MAG TPA: CDP-alcohol phosphatidyltransferase family protein [Pirellulales bacterium]|nr:CDP-alcohol phosphatidyltransferase family protein [Pirellulales bacterium]
MTEPSYQPAERRPIRTRDLAASKLAAHWLAVRGVSANAISTAGMLAAIGGGAALAATSLDAPWTRLLWLAGAAGAQLRLLANMLDGMVAIESGRASPVGELFNEAPDRVSDAAMFIGLGYAAGGNPELGYLAALAAVFTAYVRAMAKVAGAPQDFGGPMAKPQRMLAVTVVSLYNAAAPSAWQPSWGPTSIALTVIAAGGLLTALLRLRRAAAYLRQAGR